MAAKKAIVKKTAEKKATGLKERRFGWVCGPLLTRESAIKEAKSFGILPKNDDMYLVEAVSRLVAKRKESVGQVVPVEEI